MMFRSLILAATSMAAATNALYFALGDFNTYTEIDGTNDIYHWVNFTISVPGEQAGSDSKRCTLGWSGNNPTEYFDCYTPCTPVCGNGTTVTPLYWARVKQFDNQGCMDIDVWEASTDESGHNNATVQVLQGQQGYTCSSNTTQGCTVPAGSSYNWGFQHYDDISAPDPNSYDGACFAPNCS